MWKNVFRRIIRWSTEVIMPDNCAACGKLGKVLCAECVGRLGFGMGFDDRVWCLMDGGSVVMKLVEKYKYDPCPALAERLAVVLTLVWPEDLTNVVVIPVPSSQKHVRARGFDHILKLAREFSRLTDLEMCCAVERVQDSVQVGASREERWEQAGAAFGCRRGVLIDKDKKYVIFDDVMTTGATLEAMERVLRSAGARNIEKVVLVRADMV